jgi:hypothetical protein
VAVAEVLVLTHLVEKIITVATVVQDKLLSDMFHKLLQMSFTHLVVQHHGFVLKV